jgi:hypothetical protein
MRFLELMYTLAFLISTHTVIFMDKIWAYMKQKIWAYMKQPEESMMEKKKQYWPQNHNQIKIENTNEKIRGMENHLKPNFLAHELPKESSLTLSLPELM